LPWRGKFLPIYNKNYVLQHFCSSTNGKYNNPIEAKTVEKAGEYIYSGARDYLLWKENNKLKKYCQTI